MPSLNSEMIGNIKVLLPIINEQEEIATYLDTKCAEIDTVIAKKQQLLAELESYKKSLIFEYVTGKKEVKCQMDKYYKYNNAVISNVIISNIGEYSTTLH